MTQVSNSHDLPTVDETISEAFSTYPLEEAPATLSAGVMARLQKLPANVRPRFRLSWFDWALSLFTTGMAGVGLLVWQTVPPQAVVQLQVTWLIWFQRLAQMVPH